MYQPSFTKSPAWDFFFWFCWSNQSDSLFKAACLEIIKKHHCNLQKQIVWLVTDGFVSLFSQAFLPAFVYSLKVSPLIEKISDHKDFKKLLRTRNNVLVLYSKSGKSFFFFLWCQQLFVPSKVCTKGLLCDCRGFFWTGVFCFNSESPDVSRWQSNSVF